jgi:hypothetical protein
VDHSLGQGERGHRLYWTHLQGVRSLPKLAGTLRAPCPFPGTML